MLENKEVYSKWKRLVNMSKSELQTYFDSADGKKAGLSAKEAKEQGIDSGRESAGWVLKMKSTNVNDWTPTMWKWANKQISFISRMRGVKGDLYDKDGNKTRKHLALLIWGHNPKKYADGGSIVSNDGISRHKAQKFDSMNKKSNIMEYKIGGTISQTPAPLSDKIKGSKLNKVGSATSQGSSSIELSDRTTEVLKEKLAEFKKSYPNKTNITLNDLKAVYRRGSGAYSTSHRPNITRAGWSFARVNKFLEKAAGKKVKAAYVQDDDLLKYEKGGEIEINNFATNSKFKVSKSNDFKYFNINEDKQIRITKRGGKYNKGYRVTLHDISEDGISYKSEYSKNELATDLLDAKKIAGKIYFDEIRKGVSEEIDISDNNFDYSKISTDELKKLREKTNDFSEMENITKELNNRKSNQDIKYKEGGKMDKTITCMNCGWHWLESQTEAYDKYVCHKCGFDNWAFYETKYEGGGEISYTEYKNSQFNEEENKYLPSDYLRPFEIQRNKKDKYSVLLNVENGIEYRLENGSSFVIGAFDGEDLIGYVDNGAVEVSPEYQKRGIGLNLITLIKERNPKHRFGSMTPQGFNLMGAYYDKKIANKSKYEQGGLISKEQEQTLKTDKKNGRFIIEDILDKAQINYNLHFSHIYGSEYWIVGGIYYRVSDHDKIKESNYKLGVNDFRNHYDFYNSLKDDFDLSDKSKAEIEFKNDARLKIKQEGEYYRTPDRKLYDNIDNALHYMWRKHIKFFREYEEYEQGGLIAPNGKQSNLTEEQYKLVRTPEFKAWFGDWENSPETSSKVVDENGEPLVVYHGTASKFDDFKIGKTNGIFFTDRIKSAERFSIGDLKRDGENSHIKEVFIDIKKIFIKGLTKNILLEKEYWQEYFNDRPFITKKSQKSILQDNNKFSDHLLFLGLIGEEPKKKLIQYGYDGISFFANNMATTYVCFNPTQIKLADGSNTTFDGNNTDIRFKEGGLTGLDSTHIDTKLVQISKKFKVPLSYVKAQLKDGIKAEGEHTKDKNVASKIALDHLAESPYYYQKLQEMEKELEKMNADKYLPRIMSVYENGGTIDMVYKLNTPSKEPTKLNYIQQVLVRTTEFKKWFGDWETAAKNYIADNYENFEVHYKDCSKVIDLTTYEPSIEYHGSNADAEFYKFNVNKEQGIGRPYGYFADNVEYSQNFTQYSQRGTGGVQLLYKCFLKIDNPFFAISREFYDRQERANYWLEIIAGQIYYQKYQTVIYDIRHTRLKEAIESQIGDYVRNTIAGDGSFWLLMARDVDKIFKTFLISYGFTGVRYAEEFSSNYDIDNRSEFTKAWTVFDAGQIKLADGRNIGFDPFNKDIRFEQGGATSEIVETKQQDMTRAHKMRQDLGLDNEMFADGGTVFGDGKNTNNAKDGGYFKGQSHANGGIKAINKDTGQMLEVEGDEVIINKRSVADTSKKEFEGEMLTNREILSKINQMGGGVAFAKGGEINEKTCGCMGKKYKFGGELVSDYEIVKNLTNNAIFKPLKASVKYVEDLITRINK